MNLCHVVKKSLGNAALERYLHIGGEVKPSRQSDTQRKN
jgi:hypothetical protein